MKKLLQKATMALSASLLVLASSASAGPSETTLSATNGHFTVQALCVPWMPPCDER